MLCFIVLWRVTGCKAVSVIKSDRGEPSQTRMLSSCSHTQTLPRYRQNIPVPYLTFPDSTICIIFQMTFSVTYFISDNGTLNLVKRTRAICVYFCVGEGGWTLTDKGHERLTKRRRLSVRSCTRAFGKSMRP